MTRFDEPVMDTPQQQQQNRHTLAAKQTQNHRFRCKTQNSVKRPKESGFGIVKATPKGASTLC